MSAAEGSSPTGAWQLKALQELLLVLRCILRVGHAAAAVLDDLTATGALQRQSLTLMGKLPAHKALQAKPNECVDGTCGPCPCPERLNMSCTDSCRAPQNPQLLTYSFDIHLIIMWFR